MTITDYLQGNALAKDAVYDISENLNLPDETLYLSPASIGKGDIAELLQARLTGEKLVKALPSLEKAYSPDYILIDTHPGLNEEVLVAFEAIDMLITVVRPDNQDYQGLEVMAGIAKKLELKAFVVMNKIPAKLNNSGLSKKIENNFFTI